MPCAIYAFGAQQRSRYVGEVPDFGICNMAFLAPGDPLVVGSDTWRVYPLLQRGTATAFDSTSAWVGYCFRGGRVMATFPGFQVPKPVEGIVAGITPNIDALELNQDISLAAVAASTWGGAYGAHQPVEVIHSTYQAVHQSALEENYYNRLWLIPDRNGTGQRRQHPDTTGISLERIFQSAHADRNRPRSRRRHHAVWPGVAAAGFRRPGGTHLDRQHWHGRPARRQCEDRLETPGRAEPGPGHHWQSHHRLDVRTGLGRQHRRTPERIDKHPAKANRP
ncbi:hypothetical protein P4119_17910 [Pseudomonas aeruginosa]|nr:hypothetical protein [Pseudomonas aeruginosa]